jgi:hypothetical protein
VIPTFHPAAVLRGGGERSRQFAEFHGDFDLVRRTLETSGRAPEPARDGGSEAEAPPNEAQLELF